MSLLEDWEAGSGYHDPVQGITGDPDGLGLLPEIQPPSPSVTRHIFGLQVAERQLSRSVQQMPLGHICSAVRPETLAYAHAGEKVKRLL